MKDLYLGYLKKNEKKIQTYIESFQKMLDNDRIFERINKLFEKKIPLKSYIIQIFYCSFILMIVACNKESQITGLKDDLFKSIVAKESGIYFSNDIIESDQFSFNDPYFYMGGGVAIGDVNNDGLSDIFLTGNMVENKLYLNKGDLKFEDISLSAGIVGDDRWYTGVTMADVNNDGWIDIYLCVSGIDGNTTNQLYVNNQDLTFSEKAEEYGIADSTASIQATFFDYNNDGLIDLFIGNYPQVPISMGNHFYFEEMKKNDPKSSGHLFRKNEDGTFSDVTNEAGVQNFGLTIGVVATDLNNDGWKDLYISNDFNVPDYLYMNNGDGTFRERIKEATGHTSYFGMGFDASDFNNDGWMDLFQTDMVPEDYKRGLLNMASMNTNTFWEGVKMGFHYQYMQNTFQLNNGVTVDGTPIFSEISHITGTAATDWSWAILFMDLDNDGWKDIFITNGIKRDINNIDIIRSVNSNPFSIRKKISEYPSEPIENYAFRNNSDLSFTNVTKKWGLNDKGFSNGAAYGDLDNDGDLEIVINNVDDVASIYENKTDINTNHYLKIKLVGSNKNTLGLGTKITIKFSGHEQTQELTLSRGFQSSVEPVVHFGFGNIELIPEIKVEWPDGNFQLLKNVTSNQLLKVFYSDSKIKPIDTVNVANRFQDITSKSGIDFVHVEDVFNDFEREPLLPHMNSKFGPALSVGDVNGDGYEDFFVGNAKGSLAAMYIQQESGEFIIMKGPWEQDFDFEDTGAILFDADNDNDLDLYVVSGGNEMTAGAHYYQDRLYVNTSKGFVKSESSLPPISSSGSEVVPGDFDGDGDVDLFVCGRILPGMYPLPVKSYILRNEGGENDEIRYKDVTEVIAPDLLNAGLVTSAVWSDLNDDNLPELIIAGEWMPIRFFENKDGKFVEITKKIGLKNTEGWWYSLKEVDLDNDGDKDFIAGNLGLNYKYKASEASPFEIFVNDFDEDNRFDIVLSYNDKGLSLPVRGLESSSLQVPAIKRRFKTYEEFANADLPKIYGKGMLEKSLHYKATTFAHCWIENVGEQNFVMHKLPNSAQLSSINTIEVFDYNSDQNLDLLVAGNLFSSEVETTRNDAGIGLVLTTNANGNVEVVDPSSSRLVVKGEVKVIKKIKLVSGKNAFLFARNNDALKLLEFSNE